MKPGPKKGYTPKNLKWLHAKNIAENHPGWKGDDAGYSALHKWLYKQLSKRGICSECDRSGYTEWANKSHHYKRDISDWLELCKSCHNNYDGKKRNEKRQFV